MSELIDLSVVIPTRNRLQSLRNTVASLCEGKCLPSQLIIVDQGDRPILEEEISDIVAEGIRLDLLYQNVPSITMARNTGIKSARHGIVLFMDDDVLLDDDSILRLNETFKDQTIGLVAAPEAARPKQGKRYASLLGVVFLRKKLFQKGGYVCKGAVLGRYTEGVDTIAPTEWAMGYFFAVRRSLFERFGIWFDENLISYAYAEDLDFTYGFIKKAAEKGFKAVLNPFIYVDHLGSKEWRIPTQKGVYMYVINRYYLSFKHFKHWYMRALLIWSDIGEFLLRLFERQHPMDLLKAHFLCIRKLKLLRQQIFDEEMQAMIK